MANVEFGTGKTVIILSIVAACFAVLWPKIFYPMFTGSTIRKTDYDNYDGVVCAANLGIYLLFKHKNPSADSY